MKSKLFLPAVLAVVLILAAVPVFAGGFSDYLSGEAGIIAPQEREPGALYNFGSRGLPDSKVVVGGEARIIGPNDTPAHDSVMLEVPFGNYMGEAGITGPVDHIRLTP